MKYMLNPIKLASPLLVESTSERVPWFRDSFRSRMPFRERFRMLHFNLSKPDRVVLHKRIVSLAITPKEISLMSSTDLADEETQQSIKILEKESLEHSILQKTKVPLAKITHKGLQEIEDLNGGARIDRELEREQEEEQRRERERLARLRTAQKPQGSLPPESPVIPHTPIWGPPPVPPHTVHTTHDAEPSSMFSRSPVNTLFPSSGPEFTMHESELNLDEFINIDEDPLPQETGAPARALSPVVSTPTTPSTAPLPTVTPASESTPPVPTTGISPFAANVPTAEAQSRTTFDLNALWTAPKTDIAAPSERASDKTSFVDRDILGPEADDQDFDMFLEKDQENGTGNAQDTPEAKQAAFDALPQVWSGVVSSVTLSYLTAEKHSHLTISTFRSICHSIRPFRRRHAWLLARQAVARYQPIRLCGGHSSPPNC